MRIVTLFALVLAAISASSPALAGDAGPPTVSAPPAEPHANHPPKFLPGPEVRPEVENNGFLPGLLIRVGRSVRITVSADDADGDALIFRVTGLPAGAVLDPVTGVIVWSPTTADLGKHEVVFEVSDGHATVQRTTVFFVRGNRAPVADGERTIILVAGPPKRDFGGATYEAVVARDPDNDELTFVVKKQPAGARVKADGNSVDIAWEPGEEASGEHDLVLLVSDGEFATTIERTVVVLPKWAASDYRGWFLPGVGPSAFLAHDDAELFVGGAVDVTLAALTSDGRSAYLCREGVQIDCHASHHRFYAEFEVLDSTRSGAPSLFTYGAGYSASFELYPGRRYLVPHYGIELGGLVRDGLGHRVQTRPYLGVHLWADRHVWVNAALGYRVVPTELYDLSGPTFTLRAVLNPW